MDWRVTAVIPEGAAPAESIVDSVCAALTVDQEVLLACVTSRLEFGMWVAHGATVVVTNQSLMVAKDRLLGRPKANKIIPLLKITHCGVGPLLGVGPTWEVTFRAEYGSQGSMYFAGPSQAQQVESALREAVSGLRAEMADPDLAQLNRSLRTARAQPEGRAGESLSPEQLIDESRKIRQQFSSGHLRTVWDRRAQLGYGIASEGVPQPDRFWLDAIPAIAALRLGLKEHPMVAMCCGVAEAGQDRDDPEQRAAVEEFKRLYFG